MFHGCGPLLILYLWPERRPLVINKWVGSCSVKQQTSLSFTEPLLVKNYVPAKQGEMLATRLSAATGASCMCHLSGDLKVSPHPLLSFARAIYCMQIITLWANISKNRKFVNPAKADYQVDKSSGMLTKTRGGSEPCLESQLITGMRGNLMGFLLYPTSTNDTVRQYIDVVPSTWIKQFILIRPRAVNVNIQYKLEVIWMQRGWWEQSWHQSTW